MPNGLEIVTKDDLVAIREVIRAVLDAIALGHLAKVQNATPDLKYKITGYTMGASQIRIDIIRRKDESQGQD